VTARAADCLDGRIRHDARVALHLERVWCKREAAQAKWGTQRAVRASTMANPQTDPSLPYDVAEIRRHAQQSIQNGALTSDYPQERLHRSFELLNEALASEILCVLRYRHHQVVAKGIDFPQVAAEFAEHADNEQIHMMMIAERIDTLGGDPDLNPATIVGRAATEYGRTDLSLSEMIKDDLIAERIAIDIYRRMIPWFGSEDPTTRRMLEQILGDEEEHAADLASLLASIDPRDK
jgi:bacterioferritin